MKRKLLIILGGIATALSSFAKNGIDWEEGFKPYESYPFSCTKNASESSHPKASSKCEGVVTYDTIVKSTQVKDSTLCAHYVYDKIYSVVAKDECGNKDTLDFLTEHLGDRVDEATDSKYILPIYGIGTDTIDILAEKVNCTTRVMPDLSKSIHRSNVKCGFVHNGKLFVEQEIEAGTKLENPQTVVKVNLRDYCYNLGSFYARVDARQPIIKIQAKDTCTIFTDPEADLFSKPNLLSSEVCETSGVTYEYQFGEVLTVPATIFKDIYKQSVSEDNFITSDNPEVKAEKFPGLTLEQIIEKSVLNSSSQSGTYYIVAMDTTTGCTDTAATYINVVEIKSGIVWIKRPAYQEIETPYCQPVDLLLTDTMAIAKSSCSDVAIRVITVSDQDPSDSACGHYIYNVRYYLEASDSCGNIDSLWVATLHVNYEKPHVSNEIIHIPADYAKGCELAIPDVTKDDHFRLQQFCSANLQISQNIAPGTLITKDTSLMISFKDACKNYGVVYGVKVYVPDMIVKATAPESLSYTTAYGYIDNQEPLSLTDVFHAESFNYTYGDPVPGTILQKFYKKVEDGEDIEILYPYTVKGDSPEESGYYYMVATDSATGCSDTAISKIIFDIVVSSPIIANEQGEKKVSIYTPSGIVVGKEVYFKDVINDLKNGLYIVNNRKYYLKK